jgi:outer membrane biosynthesis protein TonB
MIMKLIRWLFSNIILIAFVLALTYAYVYWDNLTGEDTPAGKVIAYLSVEYDEVSEFLDSYDYGDDQASVVAEPESVAELTETASVPQVMPSARPQVRPPAQQQPALPRAMVQQPPASQQPARPQVSATAMVQQPPASQQPARPQVSATTMVQQPPASQQASRPQAPPREMVQEPLARRTMPQPVAPEREPMPAGSSEAAVTAKPASSTRELWISAREEYHRGNIEGSISNYQRVIANSTDNYDAYGELGNVYLSRGKYREAADAYFEAAAILVKQGKTGRARSLLPMLARLDRKKAEELHQLINSSSS